MKHGLVTWVVPAVCLATAAGVVRADNVSQPGTPPASTSSASNSNTGNTVAAGEQQAKQPANGLIDDSDPAWVWSGMDSFSDPKLQAGTGHTGGPGTYGTYTFHGTSVDVYGMTAPTIRVGKQDQLMGRARVVVDGKDVGLSTMISPDAQYNALICHVTGLGPGNHVIEILSDSGWIVIDYMKVTDDPSASGYNGPSIIPAGDYAIYPRNATDKCVSVDGLTDRSQANIFTPGKSRNQVWHVTPLAKDRLRISPVGALSKALTVIGPFKEPGGEIVGQMGVYTYIGDPAQQWIVRPIDGPYFQLLVVAQIKAVLDVNGNNSGDGTALIAYPNKGETNADGYNEEFAFVPIR